MVLVTVSEVADDHTLVPLPSTKKYDFQPPGMIHGGISVLALPWLLFLLALNHTEETPLTDQVCGSGYWAMATLQQSNVRKNRIRCFTKEVWGGCEYLGKG